jgi:hypothetical protein
MAVVVIESNQFMFDTMQGILLDHGIKEEDIYWTRSRDGGIYKIREVCEVEDKKIDLIVVDTTLPTSDRENAVVLDDRGAYIIYTLDALARAKFSPELKQLTDVPIIIVSPNEESTRMLSEHPNIKKWIRYDTPYISDVYDKTYDDCVRALKRNDREIERTLDTV